MQNWVFFCLPHSRKNLSKRLAQGDAVSRNLPRTTALGHFLPNRYWKLVRKIKSTSQRFISEWNLYDGSLKQDLHLSGRQNHAKPKSYDFCQVSSHPSQWNWEFSASLTWVWGWEEIFSLPFRFNSLRKDCFIWWLWGKDFCLPPQWPPYFGDKESVLLTPLSGSFILVASYLCTNYSLN